ncbi:MAG: ATP-binding protein [Cyclobacteriaceae bacterium]|nr:ATP-binding protein [Cyclobacteriaceae bacterium]
MQYFKKNQYPTSVKRKVVAGFLLVFIAISLAIAIARFGFSEMMDTVDQLSAPKNELNALNNLFHEITAFDQLQRVQAVKNPKNSYKAFLDQSNSLVRKVDSLRLMNWDSTQQIRLLEIRQILQKRNRLFFSYLKLKSELDENQSLTDRLDTLSTILIQERIAFDTSIVTTEKKTTTTYTQDSLPEKDDRSRIAKLFSKKKKNTAQTTHIKVQQELSVVIDTLSIARQNKALEEVEKIILDLENDQRAENKRLFQEELALIHANSLLINQLISILHEVEKEELAKMTENSDHAASLVTTSMFRISILLLVFLLGAAMLVYLIWVDISRSNYYKKQLEKAKEEAEELTMIKQRFLANMSHEIRTPLQSIIGFAEQLKQQQGTDDEAVSAINSSSEHLLHIVDEVLDYSRISSGSFVLGKERFRLMGLIKEVESAVRVQSDRKGLTLLLDMEQMEDHYLLGDPFRLRQILYNLLGNAIKFTKKGHVKLAIKTVVEETSVRCVFNVSDTGIGIRKEDLTKIFNQFEQANALIAGQHGGTGLGLNIVKSLVEAQGGSMDVTSEPEVGSSFVVTLTFENSEPVEPGAIESRKDGSVPFHGKVIVIDDDVMILRLCSIILKKNNIPFTTYSDPKELIQQKPDPAVTHILVDIRMPDINGVELCKVLRKKYHADVKFIAVTAHVFPLDRQELLKSGFDEVISKPFRENELITLFVVPGDKGAAPKITSFSFNIDLSTLKQMTLGDDTLLQSIITQFIEETENDLHQLDECLGGGKPKPIREIIHKLAGRIGQIGVPALSIKLRDIESALENGTALSDLNESIVRAKNDVESLLMTFRIYPMEPSR